MGGPGEVSNPGSGRTLTIQHVLAFYLDRSRTKGISVRVDPKRRRPSDVMVLEGDPSKIQKVLGWQTEIPFDPGHLVQQPDPVQVFRRHRERNHIPDGLMETVVRSVAVERRLLHVRPLIEIVTEFVMDRHEVLAANLDGTVSRWELCAFNNLCRDQYTRLGLEWAYAHTPLMTADELAQCEHFAKMSGINPEIVLATGATSMGEMLVSEGRRGLR